MGIYTASSEDQVLSFGEGYYIRSRHFTFFGHPTGAGGHSSLPHLYATSSVTVSTISPPCVPVLSTRTRLEQMTVYSRGQEGDSL